MSTLYSIIYFYLTLSHPPTSTLFPYTTLFRSFDSSEISESVNFCVMEAIKLCRLDTPIIFIEARINMIGVSKIGRAVQQECRDRSRMPSSALTKKLNFAGRLRLDGDFNGSISA